LALISANAALNPALGGHRSRRSGKASARNLIKS
jgi:hypothetical protein